MLNLAKVLCLLLVAKATSAGRIGSQLTATSTRYLQSRDSAERSFSDAITSSLEKMKASYARNKECVRNALSRVELETGHLHPELKSDSKREKFSEHISNVMTTTKTHTDSLNEKVTALDNIFEKEREILEKQQLLADGCLSSHSGKRADIRRAVRCLNKVRKSVLKKTEEAKLMFLKLCKDAKMIAKIALKPIKALKSY